MTDKMTSETAIELIQDTFCDGCQFILYDGQYNDDGCVDCIWYLVKEALERQISKKVSYNHLDALCPSCNELFEKRMDNWKSPFCQYCGQKIDWSDTK